MQRLAAQKRKGLGTTKSVDTVQLFMENNCVRTKFDTDVIKVGDFKTQYNEFCEANRLSPLNITRSLMASYGIETEKLELSYVCRKAPGTQLETDGGDKSQRLWTRRRDYGEGAAERG